MLITKTITLLVVRSVNFLPTSVSLIFYFLIKNLQLFLPPFYLLIFSEIYLLIVLSFLVLHLFFCCSIAGRFNICLKLLVWIIPQLVHFDYEILLIFFSLLEVIFHSLWKISFLILLLFLLNSVTCFKNFVYLVINLYQFSLTISIFICLYLYYHDHLVIPDLVLLQIFPYLRLLLKVMPMPICTILQVESI